MTTKSELRYEIERLADELGACRREGERLRILADRNNKDAAKTRSIERQFQWVRHNLNQRIETDTNEPIPYGNTSAGMAEQLRRKMRLEVYRTMLELLVDRPPARFNPAMHNVFAERLSGDVPWDN